MKTFFGSIIPKGKKEWLRLVKNLFLVLAGTFVLSFGIAMFIFPFELVTGGISCIGIILAEWLKGVDFLSGLKAEEYSTIVNWALFFLGFIILGKSFAAKTLLSTAFYPFALMLSEYIVKRSSLSPILDIAGNIGDYSATIVASVFGGACLGIGCALTFLGGGSTGGVDVIALTLSKYIRRLKSSVAFFICDALIIIIGVFSVGDILISLLGILSAFICAISVDKIFLGESSAFIAHVVSDKYVEINQAVIDKLVRTTTIVDATGGYSGQGKKLVMITFAMRQYPAFTQIISSIDPNAFVTVHRAHEINGEGWTYGVEEI